MLSRDRTTAGGSFASSRRCPRPSHQFTRGRQRFARPHPSADTELDEYSSMERRIPILILHDLTSEHVCQTRTLDRSVDDNTLMISYNATTVGSLSVYLVSSFNDVQRMFTSTKWDADQGRRALLFELAPTGMAPANDVILTLAMAFACCFAA